MIPLVARPEDIAKVDTRPGNNTYAEIPQTPTRTNTPSAATEGGTPIIRYKTMPPLTTAAITLVIAIASLAIAIGAQRT